MANVGAIAANFHEGSRSEYLANYVLAQFGTAISVPHQEDSGVDFYCTLVERIGRRAWPRNHYTVQVKSEDGPWHFASRDSVQWLVEHPLPLLLMQVDKAEARVRLYHTFPRFLAWTTLVDLPDSLELTPEGDGKGSSTQWDNGTRFSLGPPILSRTVMDLIDEATFQQSKAVLGSWLVAETKNIANVTVGLPMFQMPASYETNREPGGGLVFQWNTLPERFAKARRIFLSSLPWLKEHYLRQNDLGGMARAALILRYLNPDAEMIPGLPDLTSSEFILNKAMSMDPPGYVFEAVDALGAMIDAEVTLVPRKRGE